MLRADERVAFSEGGDVPAWSGASVRTGKLRRLRSNVGGTIEGADMVSVRGERGG